MEDEGEESTRQVVVNVAQDVLASVCAYIPTTEPSRETASLKSRQSLHMK